MGPTRLGPGGPEDGQDDSGLAEGVNTRLGRATNPESIEPAPSGGDRRELTTKLG